MIMTITEKGYNVENAAWFGNKFLTGNGYIGIRGSLEEYTKALMPAINIAGVYDCAVPGLWRESLNAPNALYTRVYCDGIPYALPDASIGSHEQSIDIAGGVHSRKTVFNTPKGQLTVEASRFPSMVNVHVLAMRFRVTADYDCRIRIETGIDGDVWDLNGPHYKSLKTAMTNGILTMCGTCASGVSVSVAETVSLIGSAQTEIIENGKAILRGIEYNAYSGVAVGFDKTVLVSTSKDKDIFKASTQPEFPLSDYSGLLRGQIDYWNSFWERSFVRIQGDADAETALNYSIYQLGIIAPRHARSLSIPARGLSGQVYKGAAFWDTEMFMLDFFINTDLDVARTLLSYRIDSLDNARIKARGEGFMGAFFAWESQEEGVEACTDFNVIDVFTGRPVRTYFRDKQVHISSAIVYGFYKYIKTTGDNSILERCAETIIECANFYRSLLLKRAVYAADNVKDGKWEICDVVGPDEYHERVNNDAYTNKMARFTLQFAADVISAMPNLSAQIKALGREFSELAAKIYIQAENAEGIIEQFDGYFKLEDAAVETLRSRLKDPREYWGGGHGVASDTQIIKQADVAAMLALFYSDYSRQTLEKNFDYYIARTEHGSSLSACMYALLACRIDRPNDAYPMFMKSATSDLVRPSKLWAGEIYIGGSHPASAGGAYIAAIRGFAGLEIKDGVPICTPNLPSHWEKLIFQARVHNKRYSITILSSDYQIVELQ